MTTKLLIDAITKFTLGVVLIGILIFLPAGTFSYFNGWLFMGILFVPMFLLGIVLMVKNRTAKKTARCQREAKRTKSCGEIERSNVFGWFYRGLGYRFDWYILPKSVAIGASAVFLRISPICEVLRENTSQPHY